MPLYKLLKKKTETITKRVVVKCLYFLRSSDITRILKGLEKMRRYLINRLYPKTRVGTIPSWNRLLFPSEANERRGGTFAKSDEGGLGSFTESDERGLGAGPEFRNFSDFTDISQSTYPLDQTIDFLERYLSHLLKLFWLVQVSRLTNSYPMVQ